MLCSVPRPAISLWYISFMLSLSFSTTSTATKMSGNVTDRLALLAIKSQLHDPIGVLSSWNHTMDLCQWRGVTCGSRHQRVIGLDLRSHSLRGSLSPYIGNLSFLRLINMTGNNLYGQIPAEVGRLSRLEYMEVANNSFASTIPANLSRCSNLVVFNANENQLVGKIPVELDNLLRLERLSLRHNRLIGQIPASLGNLSALRTLSLRENVLQGKIPDTLGQLRALVYLNLAQNQLSGLVPAPIYNISSLEHLVLITNRLKGGLPLDVGFTLPNLKRFIIAENNFTGPLPESLSNASNLVELDCSYNHFSGKVSISFSGLKNFWWLNLESNALGTGEAYDLDFVDSLANCSYLEVLSIRLNQFGGVLPNSMANFSTALTGLYIGHNRIMGMLPQGIENLVNLNVISAELNQLSGYIPDAIGKLKNLEYLALGANFFDRRIPPSLGNLSLLTTLGLEANSLHGNIPPTLGKCQRLTQMSLRDNMLTGVVPLEIFSIVTLSVVIDLSDNLLLGPFPSEVSNLKNLVTLDVSSNRFYGEIPATIGGCTSLENLNLERNHFEGKIPNSLSSLRSIKRLDFSHNNLSGQIPKYFVNFSFLEYLNLSYNQFEGEVPTKGIFSNATAVSLIGNKKLCGGLSELHLLSCQGTTITSSLKYIIIAAVILGFILLSSSILHCWYRYKRTKHGHPLAPTWGSSILKISYQQLLKATDGFSSANLIGEGSFGRVYKGVLHQNQDRITIAVKVFKLQLRGASRSFMAECQALRNVRHRNLVKIISACSSVDFQGNDFKALVYEFMPNGSLEMWLHAKSNEDIVQTRGGLNLLQRLNIAIDVASALDYLHNHCKVPVIHLDLKPSNVLIDSEMVAHVADFGLARFFPKTSDELSANEISSLGLRGTIGYAAPEYGMGSEATTAGDVFSYGILLLEMLTRRRPTDDMFEHGLTLRQFSRMALTEQLQVTRIVDPLLVCEANVEENHSSTRKPGKAISKENIMQQTWISVLTIGVECSVESPQDRIDISHAIDELNSIKKRLLGTGIYAAR